MLTVRHVITTLLLSSVCILPSTTLMAKGIYSFVDAEGVLHLTDRPNDPRYRPIAATNRHVANKKFINQNGLLYYFPADTPGHLSAGNLSTTASAKHTASYLSSAKEDAHPYGDLVRDAARQHGLQSALLHSIIRAESNFDPYAVSAKGAVGLMQLMPETARQYGVHDSTDPETNIHGGARFLADLLRQFNNNLELSLAAYNAGPNTVIRYGGTIPPYPETRQYVTRVLRYFREYQRVM
ncbi:lytic transglycosylase domain-containing protein [Candidatus Magnetaquicoccus inordinatus]|uniref:lytic transglycosylase domain-containing protein n=1 Tax=Candidatus Magnetaquicoccus inordinatus TaxID=2496818 RepID=UPI001D0E3B14|nr:lytic transglycosylase domain-containing protein [Candidatus Magnetaquicoccus inordinatus]